MSEPSVVWITSALVKGEAKARERVAGARIATGSDLHLIEMLLAIIDRLRVGRDVLAPDALKDDGTGRFDQEKPK